MFWLKLSDHNLLLALNGSYLNTQDTMQDLESNSMHSDNYVVERKQKHKKKRQINIWVDNADDDDRLMSHCHILWNCFDKCQSTDSIVRNAAEQEQDVNISTIDVAMEYH